MGDIVSDGTIFICTQSGMPSLSVGSCSTKGGGKKLATSKNYSLEGKGFCLVTQSPCQPSPASVSEAQSPVKIDGAKALGAGCSITCAKGGSLSVMVNSQFVAKHDGAASAKQAAAVTGSVVEAANKKRKNDEEESSKKEDAKKQKTQNSSKASSFHGSKGNQLNNHTSQPVRNKPATINGQKYSGHALDQMQNRGIPPRAVENARKTGTPKQIVRNNRISTNYYDKENNVTVVMNSKDEVVTVGFGKIGR